MYCDVLYSFVKLYGYEYISIYPAYITSESTIRDDLKEFAPILSPVIQSRFLSIFDSFYSTVLKRVMESIRNSHLGKRCLGEVHRGQEETGASGGTARERAGIRAVRNQGGKGANDVPENGIALLVLLYVS